MRKEVDEAGGVFELHPCKSDPKGRKKGKVVHRSKESSTRLTGLPPVKLLIRGIPGLQEMGLPKYISSAQLLKRSNS